MRATLLFMLIALFATICLASPMLEARGKGKKPQVEKCSEGNLETMDDVKKALVGDCTFEKGMKILRNKSAHNCKGKLYQCNGKCQKPSKFPNVESGVCII
ncbi:hypothetical protein EC973_008617 [Apophysomyces ossiformis]|uniref:Uncharacterized protein n=1 Tax=Apophysomyces ossiformis TaxID=679940 RepID=A0A8H7BT50_9FUNG|nr:hypothetical protein EC973_008617 [Apophysomyces ossiformis]